MSKLKKIRLQLDRIEVKTNRLCEKMGIDYKQINKTIGGTLPPDDDEEN